MLAARAPEVSTQRHYTCDTEREQSLAVARTARARQAGPGVAPTAFQVSGCPHVLEVVHINDIDDRGHYPRPVLKNKSTTEGESVSQTEQSIPPRQGQASVSGSIRDTCHPPATCHSRPAGALGLPTPRAPPSAITDGVCSGPSDVNREQAERLAPC